jgi:hypothetical protein
MSKIFEGGANVKNIKISFFERKGTGILLSVISLVLIICLLTVTTYSWLESGAEGEVDTSNRIEFQTDPDLSITGANTSDGEIKIENFSLREVSSVDGREVFVPDDSYVADSNNNLTSTSELRFREANAADVYDGVEDLSERTDNNKRYVSFSFYMSSASDTPVYLSTLSTIEGTGSEYVRVAINSHDAGTDPVLMSNEYDGYEAEYYPVKSIDSNGVATTTTDTVSADGLTNFVGFGNSTPLFTLQGGVKKLITVTVWLEGTSSLNNEKPTNFSDDIIATNLNIRLKLATSMDYVNQVKVVDRTYGSWAYDKNTYMFAIDADTDTEYKMHYEETEKTWTANIPQSATSIYFQRYNPDDRTQKYNMWGTKTNPLSIPGASDLYENGTEKQREAGISRTYNILGSDEIDGGKTYDSYEAGIWGEFDDSAFDEVHFFDQSSDSISDTDGYFNWNSSIIPCIDMNVSYYYNGSDDFCKTTKVTTNLRYRMFREYVGTRLFHQTQFVSTSGYTITSLYYRDYKNFDYAAADSNNDEAGGMKNVAFGSKVISATSGYTSTTSGKRYFAYTSGNTGYWGTGLLYLSVTSDVLNADKKVSDNNYNNSQYNARYATYFYNSSGNTWKSMCLWSDKYTKDSVDASFPKDDTTERIYASVIATGYTSAIHCRMDGTSSTNSWDYRWNQASALTLSSAQKDCKVDGFVDKSNAMDTTFETWTNMPDRTIKK